MGMAQQLIEQVVEGADPSQLVESVEQQAVLSVDWHAQKILGYAKSGDSETMRMHLDGALVALAMFLDQADWWRGDPSRLPKVPVEYARQARAHLVHAQALLGRSSDPRAHADLLRRMAERLSRATTAFRETWRRGDYNMHIGALIADVAELAGVVADDAVEHEIAAAAQVAVKLV